MNHNHHYKSWSSLNQQLTGLLCDSLRDRIRYFFTRHVESGGNHSRAAILLDGKELVCVYHARVGQDTSGERMTCIDRAEFVSDPNGGEDILVIHGPTAEPQTAFEK